jgi:hypothetical protein
MKFHWGRESLVRWVRNEDGTYSHDFTLFEKYVDTALKHIEPPEVTCLYAWERRYRARPSKRDRNPDAFKPPRVMVPLLDPETNEVSSMEGPSYVDEDATAFWKPVLEGCRERLLARGVAEEAILLGVVPDGSPTPATTDMFHRAAPWAKWVQHSHAPGSRFRGVETKEVPVWLAAGVYGGTRPVPDPAEKRYYGWKPYNERTEVFCVFPRTGSPYVLHAKTNLSLYHNFMEAYLMTGLRGITRVAGEFWPLDLKRETGSGASTLISAYSINTPSMNLSVYDFLAPGKEGALSTVRLETLYEGSQEGEARVFLEKAIEAHGEKLGPKRQAVQALLDQRARLFVAYYPVIDWYPASGWRERSAELYAAAAEVARLIDAGSAPASP